jgi:predicted nucleic acid-binding protein
MTVSCFVDSNVVVYARDLTDRLKQKRASRWIEALAEMGAGRISYQVLVEAYSALTRSSRRRMGNLTARLYVANFHHWAPLAVDRAIMEVAWEMQDRYGFNWWDCLIVASARACDCNYLLTEDLQHGQDLGGILVIDPFATAPEEVLA